MDTLIHLMGLPPLGQADKGQIDADAHHDIDELERAAGQGAGRHIPADESGRGPFDRIHGHGHQPRRAGKAADPGQNQRGEEKGQEHHGIEHHRQAEHHQLADVEQDRESPDLGQPAVALAAADDQHGDH